jgi:hypothetical protein
MTPTTTAVAARSATGDGTAAPASLAGDLLHGADAIAEFLFGSPDHRRKIYYYTSDARVRMPHFRLGSVICARKSTLIDWIARQEQAVAPRLP